MTKKFVFNVTGNAYDSLEELSQKTGLSKTDVLARALSLYEVIVHQMKTDSKGHDRKNPELAILENGKVKTKIAPRQSSF